jgi:hypothetical protein
MSALSDLVNLLSRSRDGVLPSMQTFAPLDIDAISNELKLEHHGKTNGSRNKPATSSRKSNAGHGKPAKSTARSWNSTMAGSARPYSPRINASPLKPQAKAL